MKRANYIFIARNAMCDDLLTVLDKEYVGVKAITMENESKTLHVPHNRGKGFKHLKWIL